MSGGGDGPGTTFSIGGGATCVIGGGVPFIILPISAISAESLRKEVGGFRAETHLVLEREHQLQLVLREVPVDLPRHISKGHFLRGYISNGHFLRGYISNGGVAGGGAAGVRGAREREKCFDHQLDHQREKEKDTFWRQRPGTVRERGRACHESTARAARDCLRIWRL